jgi:hypothetical protein
MRDDHQIIPQDRNTQERRSFLTRFGVGVAAIGLAAAPAACAQAADEPKPEAFMPERHAEDDWYDEIPGKHRFVLDSTTAGAAGAAVLYASNFYTANKNAYGLEPSDLAVVIVMRHFATPFAYTDAIWAKYGTVFGAIASFNDPKTKMPPDFNIYTSADYGMELPNLGNTLGGLIEKGAQFAVCDMATHFVANFVAQQTKGDADMIYQELAAGLIPNARLVSAGIVAVNRAQERGYTFAYVT